MERHPWRLTKPLLTFQNCTQDSLNSPDKEDEKISLVEIVNFSGIKENEQGNVGNINSTYETTTLSDSKVISTLNEEIVGADIYNISNKDAYGIETTVRIDEIPNQETTTSGDDGLTDGTESNNEENLIQSTTLNYESQTINEEVSTLETTEGVTDYGTDITH